MITWTCHMCRQERPDDKISVHAVDRSRELLLPAGSFRENFRYCNDREECRAKALAKGSTV